MLAAVDAVDGPALVVGQGAHGGAPLWLGCIIRLTVRLAVS